MAISECPVCTFHIPVESGMQEGDQMECPDCGALLKLVSLSPPLFERAGEG